MEFSSVLLFAASITGTSAHSWIHCSDYRGDRGNYEPGKCFGHPRPMNGQVPAMGLFGLDIGYNKQPDTTCHMGAMSPLAAYPMARYKQGQQVVLAWPSKNHVAASCTNAFIPDTSLELFIAPEDADGHPDEFTQIPASFSDDPHVKGEMDFKGFQNCPNFCDNMDKALCTGSFFVPANLPDGVYTFQWKWVFNEGTAPYITCFEAYVGQDVAPVAAPTAAPTVEGQVPAPTVPAQENCTVGEWGQCGGPGHEGKCCTGGLPCQRQSEWYSQCRSGCPSGWECENAPAPTPIPVASPTPMPVAATTPVPVASPTPAPVATPTPAPVQEPCVPDVTTCETFLGVEGRLMQADGKASEEAFLDTPCECYNFCKMFSDGAAYWTHKGNNKKCTCYVHANRIQEAAGSNIWSGTL